MTRSYTCFSLAVLMTISPYTPSQFLWTAKQELSVASKISVLRRLINSFPLDASTKSAREDLVRLLVATHRYSEALQEYRKTSHSGERISVELLELLLKNGLYNEILKLTSVSLGQPDRDLLRDQQILTYRVQALLALGQYAQARRTVDAWLRLYQGDGVIGGRYEIPVRNMSYLFKHLMTMERQQGREGKPLFTAAIPDSLRSWSRRSAVPLYIYKLVPAHPVGQLSEPVLPGRYDTQEMFAVRLDEVNDGFSFLSGGLFSVELRGVDTLYVHEGDLDPIETGGDPMIGRVFVHTLPPLYQLAGKGFVMLVDYRENARHETAYMGDGIIHISADKIDKPLTVMHEILHGLGATHQEWVDLEAKGYHFDERDRGLMTFVRGEIELLGLEEKNRALLGWPETAVVKFRPKDIPLTTASLPDEI